LQKVIWRGLQQFEASLPAQPWLKNLFGQKDWHAIVYFGDKLVRFGDYHRAGRSSIEPDPLRLVVSL
jgi:hypothetical protein